MLSRREFLHRSSLVSLYPVVPVALGRLATAAPAEADSKILVVIQLDGGNDGINTVVPYGDDAYAANRKMLRLDTSRLHKLNEHVGLHPQMRGAKELFDDGRLTIVQGVGYPNPSRSHFNSMRIWQTARLDEEEHDGYGWLGRALDLPEVGINGVNAGQPGAIYTGSEAVPVALWGRRSEAMSLTSVADLKLPFPASQLSAAVDTSRPAKTVAIDSLNMFVTRQVLSAYAAADQFQRQTNSTVAAAADYPATQLGTQLKLISQLIKRGSRARVYYTLQGGYDTHAAQLYTHAQLLGEFSAGLKAFLDDVKKAGLDNRVVVLAFSEFGRRVKENASEGTDHGAAGPVFLAGGQCVGGLVGSTPNLTDLDQGDLKHEIDLRQIYAAILDNWLQADTEAVLAGAFDKLPILRS